jgi:hypothetical protein
MEDPMKTIYDLYKDDSVEGRGIAPKVISGDSIEVLECWIKAKHPDYKVERTKHGTVFTVGLYTRYYTMESALTSAEDISEVIKVATRLEELQAEKSALEKEERELQAFLEGKT